MIKRQIEQFLIEKKGYIKKHPLKVAEKMWKNSDTHTLPKTSYELDRELNMIKEVQKDLRKAKKIESIIFDDKLQEVYQTVLAEKNRVKRTLYFDIETSPNVVFTWNVGYKLNIGHDSILQERAIICICYKWSDEEEVHSLQWNKGKDKEMLEKFAKIINMADIICGHNSDKYDLPFIRTRCLYHGINLNSTFNSLDTLKMARSKFRLNSNKLDYISTFLGFEGKSQTSYGLWKDIVLDNSEEAMNTMVSYCKNDVKIQEEVHKKLKEFVSKKRFE